MKTNKPPYSVVFIALISFSLAHGQTSPDQLFYIEQYQSLAIREMLRSKIPASITLAQGILESGAGQSELARQANNHFGIKCGGNWSGLTYYKINSGTASDENHDPSCYRSYPTVDGSFIDHSDFIAGPRLDRRYDNLFLLAPTDYEGWAHGLLRYGYAECTDYPERLISLINRYNLDRFDLPTSSAPIDIQLPVPQPTSSLNGVPFTTASGYELAQDIANRTKVPLGDLLIYNENLPLTYVLPEGQVVYLDCPQREAAPVFLIHLVQRGETMANIAQRHGIRLDSLLSLNLLQPGDEPQAGEIIILKGRSPSRPPRLIPSSAPTPLDDTAPPVLFEAQTAQFYTVVKGDNLWRISQRYNTTVDAINALNNLSGKIIWVGMVLRVR